MHSQVLVGNACLIQYRAAKEKCPRPEESAKINKEFCYPIFMDDYEYEKADIKTDPNSDVNPGYPWQKFRIAS